MIPLKEKLIIWAGVAVTVVLVLIGYNVVAKLSSPGPNPGAVGTGLPLENYLPVIQQNGGLYTNLPARFDNGLQVGANGTNQKNQVDATCSMVSNAVITATTTGYGFCTGVTGVTSADNVDANFATSSLKAADQWIITGAIASSTPGAIDFRILNLTGANNTFSGASTIGSSTILQVGH